MINKETLVRTILMLIALLILALFFIVGPGILGLSDISLDSNDMQAWNEWQMLRQDGSQTSVLLPLRVDAQKNEIIRLVRTLPPELTGGSTVCMRASSQQIIAYVDGEKIASYGEGPDQRLSGKPGSAWFSFRLPEDCAGKQLMLEYTSPYEQYSGYLNRVLYGSKSAILFAIARKYGMGFAGSVFVFISGSLGFIVNMLLCIKRKDRPYSMLFLCVFAMIASLWSMCESRVLQFFIGNQILVSYGSFLALMLMPLPFIMYMDTAYVHHHIKFSGWFFSAFLLNFLCAVVLQLVGAASFFEIIPVTHVLVGMYLAAVVCSLIFESVKYDNRDAKTLLWALAPLIAAALAEIVNFALERYDNVSDYMGAGLICYVVVMASIALRNLYKKAQDGREAEYFKQMAFMDFLTGGKNRAAFQRDVEKLLEDGKAQDFWLISMDMNGLKSINDNYGHLEGDRAIKTAFNVMSAVFSPNGECYRMGGDEFICIRQKGSEADVKKCLEQLNAELCAERTGLAYDIKMACGYACYKQTNWADFAEFWSFVDKKMYRDKEKYWRLVKRPYIERPAGCVEQ